jgi:hypothetical protein
MISSSIIGAMLARKTRREEDEEREGAAVEDDGRGQASDATAVPLRLPELHGEVVRCGGGAARGRECEGGAHPPRPHGSSALLSPSSDGELLTHESVPALISRQSSGLVGLRSEPCIVPSPEGTV